MAAIGAIPRALLGGARRRAMPALGSPALARRQLASLTPESELLRNIGILAHIDAGKTTVTERMLFHAGELKQVGEVHDGDTVMDYLALERERGITINSAATSFPWRGHELNLIDTPGHVDFTVEVERAVRVLDGAVALIDAVAGVQAQSETVWRQANRYGVPRLVFINKMDREGADFDRAVASIEARLGARCLVTQLPFVDADGDFSGVLDLVDGQLLQWPLEKTSKEYETTPWAEAGLPASVLAGAKERRRSMYERLADEDEAVLEALLDDDAPEALAPDLVRASIRRLVLAQQEPQGGLVPVLCGSALKNVGVQPLLDAVVAYLPAPHEKWAVGAASSDGDGIAAALPTNKQQRLKASKAGRQGKTGKAKALVFKIQHDPQRGPLAFVRVFDGHLKAKEAYHNVTLAGSERAATAMPRRGRKGRGKGVQTRERVMGMLRAYADDLEPIEQVDAGDIAILVGLKHVRTGDTLSDAPDAAPLPGITIPSPVFSVSVELESLSQEARLTEALEIMVRDDPSLAVSYDEETAQLLVAGMGELHLEVVLSKLTRDFGIECAFSKVRVAYRETLLGQVRASGAFSPGDVAADPAAQPSDAAAVTVGLVVEPTDSPDEPARLGGVLDEALRWASGSHQQQVDEPEAGGSKSSSSSSSSSSKKKKKKKPHVSFTGDGASWELSDEQMHGLATGILDGMLRGPLLGFPLQGVQVRLDEINCRGCASAPAEHMRAAAAKAVRAVLEAPEAAPAMLEPYARLEVTCTETHVGAVMRDLSSRRPQSLEVDAGDTDADAVGGARQRVVARVPLEQVLGYATTLRSMTAGEAAFSVEPSGYAVADAEAQARILSEY